MAKTTLTPQEIEKAKEYFGRGEYLHLEIVSWKDEPSSFPFVTSLEELINAFKLWGDAKDVRRLSIEW
ncbi:gp192 [Sphingomonas phage PAU]|uniref:gp192 n=1 Tax=Sphingomonas phage PAU TaxID=1150991 RepID=UPI000257335E|nr:gp192 [Sphingomonas phage PAU]AFF28190.1 gp192 [Sphingomonas phage PAU]